VYKAHEHQDRRNFKIIENLNPEEKEISVDKRKLTNATVLNSDSLSGLSPTRFSLNTPEEISIWWDGYIKTYLERDLRDLSHITSLTDFRNVMQLLALRTASIVDQTGISRDTGISQPTVHRYISLLEASNLFVRLRPFTKIKAKSLTKSPKGYFIDPGLASQLAGYRSPEAINDKFKGNLFESLILLNLLVIADIYQMNIYHWRTREGKEVDFVLECGRDILPVEVKLSGRWRMAIFRIFSIYRVEPESSRRE